MGIYLVLIITQFILGKKGAFAYGLLLHMDLYVVSVVVIACDLFLMVVVARLLEAGQNSIGFLKRLQKHAQRIESKVQTSTLARRLLQAGKAGVLIITAVPMAGGVWSGMALAHILQSSRREAYWLVGVGSVFGCLVFLLAALGIIETGLVS